MTTQRSCCPVSCALEIIGDKWTLLVVRDLLLGRAQFKDFMASPEGISTNILADRLKRLVDHELVERLPSREHFGRDSYRLTPKGKSLGKVVEAIKKWGLDHIDGGQPIGSCAFRACTIWRDAAGTAIE